MITSDRNSVVLFGHVSRVLPDGKLVLKSPDGEITATVGPQCEMWMLWWKMEMATDITSHAFERYPPETKNRFLITKKPRDIYFRLTEDHILLGGYTRSYKVFDAENIVSVMQRAVPDCVTKVEVPSDGLHGGILRAVERKPYDHFTAFIKVDCGSKDGKTPLRGWGGGYFGEHEVLFGVTTPVLKTFARSIRAHFRDPCYLAPFTISHNGEPAKRLLHLSRDMAIRNEYVDSLCDKLAVLPMPVDSIKTIMAFYMKRTDFSQKTLSALQRGPLDYTKDMTYLDFCLRLHQGASLPLIPSAQGQVRTMASELLVLGGHIDEVMESVMT